MVAVSLKKSFFQAEDGIRDGMMWTGVQTCALPILEEGAPTVQRITIAKSAVKFGGQVEYVI